jgi:LmbE family N-acetylglucosaminyl deacetylase
MATLLKLMCVLAHPDDESFGMGGMLAHSAAEGVATYLVTATGGELGWSGDPADNPGPAALRELRRHELGAAAEVLGIREVSFLGYQDGELDQAEPGTAIAQIAAHIRRVRPQVVVTFDPFGVYGHPDHIAISQHATAAVVAAADPYYVDVTELPPHRVSKLYYMVWNDKVQSAFEAAFGELVMKVNGQDRRPVVWPEWAITTRVDTSAHWERVWEAISCHRSQLPGYQVLKSLPEEQHQNMWGSQLYHRVFSLVNGGPNTETDLFDGFR